MAPLEIRLLGDPVLREAAREIEEVDDELRALVEAMWETMYLAEGVGLAAPQVGVSRRVLVADARALAEDPEARTVLVNPRIVEASDEQERGTEGCLSIPGVEELVPRSVRVVVEGLDLEGRPLRIEADGFYARVLQHEIDHLDGVLFIDRISPLKRSLLLGRYRKLRDEEES